MIKIYKKEIPPKRDLASYFLYKYLHKSDFDSLMMHKYNDIKQTNSNNDSDKDKENPKDLYGKK